MRSASEEQARHHTAACRDAMQAHQPNHLQLWAIWADWGIPLCFGRNPRHLSSALALLHHPTIRSGCLLRYHLGCLAPHIRDSPDHPSHPKEEITFILLSLLIISFQFVAHQEPGYFVTADGRKWVKHQVQQINPGIISTLSLSQIVQLSLIFFHLFPLSLRTVNWQFRQSRCSQRD